MSITRSAAGGGQGYTSVLVAVSWAMSGWSWTILSKQLNTTRADMIPEIGFNGEFMYINARGGWAPTQVNVLGMAEAANGWKYGSLVPTMVGGQGAPPTKVSTWPIDPLTQAEADARYEPAGDYAAANHNHDASYDGRYVNVGGDTMTGVLNANGAVQLNGSWINNNAGGGWRLRIHGGGNGPDNVSWDNLSWVDVYGKNYVANSQLAFKENVRDLDAPRALAAFEALRPVVYDTKPVDAATSPPLSEEIEPPDQFGFVLEDMQAQPALKSVVRDTGYVPDQLIPVLVAKIRQLEARLAAIEEVKP